MLQDPTKEIVVQKGSVLLVLFVLSILTMSIIRLSPSLLKTLNELYFKADISISLPASNLIKKTEYNFPNIVNKLVEKISLINKEEKIKNEEMFGTFNNYSVVIVIQVNIRIHYLQHLIRSLGQAQDIDKALLVFSHDFFDDNINRLINSIKFCKFIQIFYPYSVQAYPDVFPGPDPRDCPKYTAKNETIRMGCVNALHLNSQGNYRNPQLTQVKHHWWWKANRVFNFASLHTYQGLVLFLEEDNYVLKDFIHVLKLMDDMAKYWCKNCKLLALADNLKSVETYLTSVKTSKVAITDRFSNYGMAFNRSVWREIAECRYAFCYYDDYNFDLSLRNVFFKCLKGSHFLVLYAAKVFHIGVCGLHATAGNCNPAKKLKELEAFFHKGSRYLFPTQLHLVHRRYRPSYNITFGGWFDPRDCALCLGMTIR